MTLAVEAIFENGVLKPLSPLGLAEQQKVHLVVEIDGATSIPTLRKWHWHEAQAIQDGFAGAVAEELVRQRSES